MYNYFVVWRPNIYLRKPTDVSLKKSSLPATARPADRAYSHIRQDILRGQAPPGAHLKEEELALALGVSRSPVRDALRRLAGEGLVRIERDRGTYVTRFDADEIDEIFYLRAALEGYGAARAIKHLVPADLAALESLARDMEKLEHVRHLDLDRFSALNNAFHQRILAASRSARLNAMVSPLIDVPIVMLKQQSWRGKVNVAQSNAQHREIIAALSARDPIWARTRMQSHIISTRPRNANGAQDVTTAEIEVL